MQSSGMLHCVILVRIDVSEDCIAYSIRLTRIGSIRLLVPTNVVCRSMILVTLMMKGICSF
jgi:hypothetical protein